MHRRGQGAIEYLILVSAALAIVTVVVLFSTGVIGGQKTPAQLNACRQAASSCYAAKLAYPMEPCSQCDTACLDAGKDILSGTAGCGLACTNCKAGAADLLYEGAYYAFYPTDRDAWTASTAGWTFELSAVSLLDARSPANIGDKSIYTLTLAGENNPNSYYSISGELGNISKRRYLIFWMKTAFAAPSGFFSVFLESGADWENRLGKYLVIDQPGSWYKVVMDFSKDVNQQGTPDSERITRIRFQTLCYPCSDPYAWTVDNLYFSAVREGTTVVTPSGQICSDGTPYGQCSAVQPKYCDAGALINKCSMCGCPENYKCCPNEACVSTTQECPGGPLD